MRNIVLALMLAVTTQAAQAALPVYKMHSKRGCNAGSCQLGQATGVITGQRNGKVIWVTAGHCLGTLNMIEIDGEKYPSNVIARVPVNDLIPDEIVFLETQRKVPSYAEFLHWSPSDRTPRVGDKIWMIGFPGGKYKRLAGVIQSVDGDQFTTLPHIKPGASGGGVFLQDSKEFIGIINAYYNGGKQEGIMSRMDMALEQLGRDGHNNLIPRKEKDAPDVDTPGDDDSVSATPKVDLEAVLKAEIERARERAAEAAKRAAEEEAARDAKHQAEIERLGKLIEGLARPPVEQPAPVIVEPAPVVEPEGAATDILGKIPWGMLLGVAGAAGVAVPGGVFGMMALKGGLGLLRRRRRRKKAAPQEEIFPRDTSEAEQLLQLRSQERSPVNDALFGMLWQDFAKANPSSSMQTAEQEVLRKFNQIAPIATPQDKE